MKQEELEYIISGGEDTKTQFKENVTNTNKFTQEFAAFSNSLGGKLILGVTDDGFVSSLSSNDKQRLNKMISNVASQNVKPPIYPLKTYPNIESLNNVAPDLFKAIIYRENSE